LLSILLFQSRHRESGQLADPPQVTLGNNAPILFQSRHRESGQLAWLTTKYEFGYTAFQSRHRESGQLAGAVSFGAHGLSEVSFQSRHRESGQLANCPINKLQIQCSC
jgi:hypothetical protein